MAGRRPPRSRGLFYSRMRTAWIRKQSGKSPVFSRCFRWAIWVSVSLYFLICYLVAYQNPTSLHQPSFPRPSHAARALMESHSNSSSRPLQKGALLNDLKVFVYDLPSKFNADWLSNERCGKHLFASEVAIHRALLTSHVRTVDAWEADFFFVPVYVSCNFSAVNGFPAIGHARPLLAAAVELVSSWFPFWNRSLGSDHVFVASHDFGSCFHTMEDVAVADGIPPFLKNSIILQTFGVKTRHPCQEAEHVLIPPYVSPAAAAAQSAGLRDIWAFFRGKMELHPKNVSGRFYSKRVRTMIWESFNRDPRFYLRRRRFSGYLSEIARSVFCLCPRGWAPWSPRLVEAVVLGCVPVIIADGIRLPFSSAVRWPEISLTVAERDVPELGRILQRVAATNLSAIQRNLWDPFYRRALLFNDTVMEGDATWHVFRALSDKLGRSYRRARYSSE